MIDPHKSEDELRDHSRFFKHSVYSKDPDINSFLDNIIEGSFSDLTRTLKENLRPLILDLYLAYYYDPDTLLAVHRDKNKYKKTGRYRVPKVSAMIIKAMDHMEERGFIYKSNFRSPREHEDPRTTRIWATEKLIEKFQEPTLNIYSIGLHPLTETVFLRDKDKNNIEYKDNRQTIRSRKILEKYNNLLQETHVDCVHIEQPYIERSKKARGHTRKPRVLINQHSKHCYRVFNQNFKKGGRVFGPFWQAIGKAHRGKIKINGRKTAELDFGGWHIALLYAIKGISYYSTYGIKADPYDVDVPEIEDPDYKRWLLKQLMLVSINAKTESSAFNAIQRMPTDEDVERPEELVLSNALLSSILDKLRDRHKEIADCFCTGKGIELQNVDGEITMNLIAEYTNRGIPILTIHDSYICPEAYNQDLFYSMLGQYTKVAKKYGIEPEDDWTKSDTMWTKVTQLTYIDEEFDYHEPLGGKLHQELLREKEWDYRETTGYLHRYASWNNRLVEK